MDEAYQTFQGLFEGKDKLILAYRSWRPVFCEKICVIVHGLGEHSGRYEHLVQSFSNQGIGFYAYDHRGHGKSKGLKGHAPTFGYLAQDLEKFLKLISIHENNRPIYLLGHSFGGLVCLKYLMDEETKDKILPRALILSNPMLKLALPIPAWKLAIAKWLYKGMPRLRFHNEVDLADLSRDPLVEKACKEDPLSHQKISAGLYFEMLKTMEEVISQASKITLPILVLLGESDRIIAPQGGRQLFEKISSKEKKLKIYPNFHHEIINEIGKEEVFQDISAWLSLQESPVSLLDHSKQVVFPA